MIKVAVIGVLGRMGQSISSMVVADDELELTGATEMPGHPELGKDLINAQDKNIIITDNIQQACDSADIIIDFTNPENTLKTVEYARGNDKSVVVGTTGFDPVLLEKFISSASKIPCVFSPNMSIGVNILFEISKQVARLLGTEYDSEIIETHHRNKVDSPSGTALGLGKAVAEGLGVKLEDNAVFERHGNIGERKKGTIGIQTLRGGDVVGDHTVLFLGDGERIELTHRATSRNNFSSGVLKAVKWLHGKSPGIYSMKDVLGI